ncbi:hypothetical protein HBI56_064920 [Parastagonospora nodorum]|nr:hypothetical protein HBH56_199420 [Parastagonospora nodorum]KAH3924732.1 hypothetical protein HBH54_192390 [Parastagonospora nodorum]KAH3938643.1 hypothetical protein HBH53_248560 [Parastagonospora nodorum]KAH3966074.1 hypothetical protein HBH52_202880 [Parastagonospora nodorum]KAH4002710.1 hypothetical protein HBI10_077820 [Parastagonospora nodorum]
MLKCNGFGHRHKEVLGSRLALGPALWLWPYQHRLYRPRKNPSNVPVDFWLHNGGLGSYKAGFASRVI